MMLVPSLSLCSSVSAESEFSGLKLLSPPFHKNVSLSNIYSRQLTMIIKAVNTLHEDLQFDLHADFEALGERFLEHRHILYTAAFFKLNVDALAAGEFESLVN